METDPPANSSSAAATESDWNMRVGSELGLRSLGPEQSNCEVQCQPSTLRHSLTFLQAPYPVWRLLAERAPNRPNIAPSSPEERYAMRMSSIAVLLLLSHCLVSPSHMKIKTIPCLFSLSLSSLEWELRKSHLNSTNPDSNDLPPPLPSQTQPLLWRIELSTKLREVLQWPEKAPTWIY